LEPAVINDYQLLLMIINYDMALELSRVQNKPILIDFTGWACVNYGRAGLDKT